MSAPTTATDLALVRLRVEDLLCRYERAIDDDDLESWPDFFTDDCEYGIWPRENDEAGLPMPLMLCRGTGMLRDRVLAHREANIFAPHVYRHFHSGLVVDLDGSRIQTVSNYVVIRTLQDGESHIYQTGCATDTVVEQDGKLLFSGRRIVYDTLRVQTLLVTPI
ncbi:nuclear transport factor 2 family protein [Amycolatopsis sp. NPDC005232]|uniref:aromatic-ring-hydroxylating dioxygenase subunit beta n=1 Tax=Amycolatopsis sp. NPDC005232 TaxID=3157027 RepID=UPI0033A5A5BC